MIKLVAFDWNGTLIADAQTVVDCSNEQLKIFGNKKIDIKNYRQNFEIPVNKFFKNIGLHPKNIEKNYMKSGDIFHTCYEKKVNKLRTRAGTKKTLEWLKLRKINSVIVSNHAVDRIHKQIVRLKIVQNFDEILANRHTHDSYTIKGKENRLIDYIQSKRLKPTEVLVIGDTQDEIIIGQDMGARTVAITNGHSSIVRLKAAKPDFLINNLGELIAIIRQINKN